MVFLLDVFVDIWCEFCCSKHYVSKSNHFLLPLNSIIFLRGRRILSNLISLSVGLIPSHVAENLHYSPVYNVFICLQHFPKTRPYYIHISNEVHILAYVHTSEFLKMLKFFTTSVSVRKSHMSSESLEWLQNPRNAQPYSLLSRLHQLLLPHPQRFHSEEDRQTS